MLHVFPSGNVVHENTARAEREYFFSTLQEGEMKKDIHSRWKGNRYGEIRKFLKGKL